MTVSRTQKINESTRQCCENICTCRPWTHSAQEAHKHGGQFERLYYLCQPVNCPWL